MALLGLEVDRRLRDAAILFLEQLSSDGKPLVRQEDLAAFRFEGAPVRLMATQQGIWKPRQLTAALWA
jgi:putative restriction endonuclease